MEKKMEPTRDYRGYLGIIKRYVLGLCRDNGKEHGSYKDPFLHS